MYRVKKEFKFEAAHRLLQHAGKCRHLHGHSYRAVVSIAGEDLKHPQCMVVDFQEVTDKLGTWINANFDHNAILNSQDFKLIQCLYETNARHPYCIQSTDPTAEVIAETIFRKAKELLRDPAYHVESVEVFETVSCSASYSE